MSIRLGIVMDPIDAINIKKDSSFAMLLEAQSRSYEIHYMELADIRVRAGIAKARTRRLSVQEDPSGWFSFGSEQSIELGSLDVILMRKDPPFDMEFIYATYALERAEEAGALIVNKPQSLRDANEKFFTAWFAQCTPETMITRSEEDIRAFLAERNDIIVKPLDGMGGASIFRIREGDSNTSTIIETLTGHGQRFAMAQAYVPEIVDGDKRILVIDGEPIPYALARVPARGELRGNLAAGAEGEGRELTERDRWIAEQVGPTLKERGLIFVGLDVIGDYLTEINVTSPTCIRELDRAFDCNIAGWLFDAIERRLNS
ncbi:MAG: glutathione synthase [Gammaproteobacteria bacterium]|nr:glutathione synthase [Gammaproteobacteria bacterium]|tara:strand:- start:92 stop:1042 length:951 start_codon:yes stop_codon:yes gene_type:complete